MLTGNPRPSSLRPRNEHAVVVLAHARAATGALSANRHLHVLDLVANNGSPMLAEPLHDFTRRLTTCSSKITTLLVLRRQPIGLAIAATPATPASRSHKRIR